MLEQHFRTSSFWTHDFPFWLFCVYLFALPISSAAVEVTFVAHVVLTLALWVRNKKIDIPHQGKLLFYVPIAVGILFTILIASTLFQKSTLNFKEILALTKGAKVFFIFSWSLYWGIIFQERLIKIITKVLPAVIVLVSIYALLQSFFKINWFGFLGSNRPLFSRSGLGFPAKGFFTEYLTFGHTYIYYFALSFLVAIDQKKRTGTWLNWTTGLTALLVVVLTCTYATSVWISLGVLFMAIGFCYLKKKFILIAIISCTIAGAFTYLHPAPNYTVRFILNPKTDYQGFGARLRAWAINFKIFQEHPLIGIGRDQNKTHYEAYRLKYYPASDSKIHVVHDAHNQLLEVLATNGLTGAFLWLIFWLTLFVFFWNHRLAPLWRKGHGALWIMLAIGITALIETPFDNNEIAHNCFALLGLIAAQCLIGTKLESAS